MPHCSFLSALELPDLMMRCLVILPDIVGQVTIFDQFSKAPGGEALPSLSPWLYTCTATSCQHVLVFLVWFFSPLLFLFIVCFDLMLTPEVAVEHLSVSPSPSSWARVEARPESSVLARLWNKMIMRPICCCCHRYCCC